MKVIPTRLREVLLFEPDVFSDDRGYFFESWNRRTWMAATGLDVEFVQDNVSRSRRYVLRGIHYQVGAPQGKLVRVSRGAIWDVAVDLRRGSPTFLQWVGYELSEDNHRMLWIPPGFGHGFLSVADPSDVAYKTSGFYVAEFDRSVRFDDPEMAIDWPMKDGPPILSEKDQHAPAVAVAELLQWDSS